MRRVSSERKIKAKSISPGIYGGYLTWDLWWFYYVLHGFTAPQKLPQFFFCTLNGCNGAQPPAIPILFWAAMGTQVSVPRGDCIPNWSWWLSIPLFEIWDDVKWTPIGCLMGWFVIDFTALMENDIICVHQSPNYRMIGNKEHNKVVRSLCSLDNY